MSCQLTGVIISPVSLPCGKTDHQASRKVPAYRLKKIPSPKTVLLGISTAALLGAQFSRRFFFLHHKVERLERMWRASLSLNQVTQAIMATTGDLDLLMETVESVARTMHYDHGGVFLADEDGSARLLVGYGYFVTNSFHSQQNELLQTVESALKEGDRGYFSYGDDSGERLVPNASWQVLYPLATRDRLLGALFIACDKAPSYPVEAVSLGRSLASLVAIGVQNFYFYRQRQELAAAAERDRIARDIHDGIAQQLYMLALTLETCIELADENEAQALRERLGAALSLSRGALWESRQYLLDIGPLFSTHGSLREAISGLVKEAMSINPIPIDFHISGREQELEIPARTELYRVVQESIANAYKHARATHISLKLDFQPTCLRVEVEDNGIGFSYQPTSQDTAGAIRQDGPDQESTSVAHGGHGLRNMHRRMKEIDGSLEIVTAPGQGTKVIATVPF